MQDLSDQVLYTVDGRDPFLVRAPRRVLLKERNNLKLERMEEILHHLASSLGLRMGCTNGICRDL